MQSHLVRSNKRVSLIFACMQWAVSSICHVGAGFQNFIHLCHSAALAGYVHSSKNSVRPFALPYLMTLRSMSDLLLLDVHGLASVASELQRIAELQVAADLQHSLIQPLVGILPM